MKKKLKTNNPITKTDNPIVLSPRKTSIIFGAIALILVLISLTGQILRYLTEYDNAFGLISLVDVNLELSIPTMFSVILLFITSALLAVITVLKKKRNEQFVWSWAILTIGFLYMSLDEMSSIHELAINPIRKIFGDDLPGYIFFAWVVPAIVVVSILAISYVKFFFKLPKKTKIAVLISAVLYLGGALGLEMIGGYYASIYGIKNLGFNLISTVEETFEMAGIIVFINALMKYIQGNFKEVIIYFKN